MSFIILRENLFSRLVEFVVGKPGRVIGLRISHGNLETLKFQLSIMSLPIEPILLLKM